MPVAAATTTSTMKINIEIIAKNAIQYTTMYATNNNKKEIEMQKLQANQQRMISTLNKI